MPAQMGTINTKLSREMGPKQSGMLSHIFFSVVLEVDSK